MTDSKRLYEEYKKSGLTPRQNEMIRGELAGPMSHETRPALLKNKPLTSEDVRVGIAKFGDMAFLQDEQPVPARNVGLSSIDELLERDKLREKDGFPRKIRIGKLIKPGKGDKNAIVVVPTTVEEKFIHDTSLHPAAERQMGGSGGGDEGEVIGEQPVRPDQDGQGTGAGQGEEGEHEVESNAYELGKILSEKFELPNLKDKGSKRSLSKFTYDITDSNRGFGQVIDKKATLRQIMKTNFALGRIDDVDKIRPEEFLVAPGDRIFRILSREKEYESQAMVFFVRDYSGSMAGKCTEMVVTQHVFIYSWLLYQYSKRVETRFIVHDTEAREVPDFYSYYNSKVAGGTQVSSGYKLVNEIVEKENLAQDYNIYIFQGTDGDDWDTKGDRSIPELKKMLEYANRIGITLVEHGYAAGQQTEVQRYLEGSGVLKQYADLLRMDILSEDADESRIIESIRKLISVEQPG